MNTLNKLSFIGLFAVALGLISCNKESPDQGNGWYCATDDGYWSSLDYGDLYLKRLPKMYINLSRYEMPANN